MNPWGYVGLGALGLMALCCAAVVGILWRESRRPLPEPARDDDFPPLNHLTSVEAQLLARLETIRAELEVADFRAQLNDRHDWSQP